MGTWKPISLFLLLLMTAAAVLSAGDIQVLCAPGLRVFLDGELKGTSTPEEDGLFLVDVPRGAHTVRVEKDGFVPRSFEVDLLDLPVEVKVDELSAEPQSSVERRTDGAEVTQLVGSLVVTSAPQNCVVEVDGRSETKSTPHLPIGGLAAGEHTIAFSKPGYERISGVVSVQPGVELTVRGNLMAGRVEVVHEGKGSLRVISEQTGCTVRFLGRVREMTRPKLNLSYVPAGEHRLVVSWRGLELSTTVLVTNGRRTVVTVSFMKGDEPFVVSHEPE